MSIDEVCFSHGGSGTRIKNGCCGLPDYLLSVGYGVEREAQKGLRKFWTNCPQGYQVSGKIKEELAPYFKCGLFQVSE